MNTKEWLNKVAYVTEKQIGPEEFGLSEIYQSKFDHSYITHVGMEDNVEHLAKLEITEELTHGVGFSPKDNKWYGWSHRAIYGFEPGSTCKKGDCHYEGATIQEQEEDAIRFWQDDCHINVRSEGIIDEAGERFFDIKWDYTDDVPNEKIRNTIGGCLHHIKPLGRGEWTAKTMGDAKIMAQYFNEGVS